MKQTFQTHHKAPSAASLVSLFFLGLCVCVSQAETFQPPTAGRAGVSLYVSKQGNDSDGRSWKTAFQTIQKALDAVPDDKGGHKIFVKPGRYLEANLGPSHPGAKGAYNCLIGDFDGSLGSGASGWVLIDSSDPIKGFKSWDWWSTIRAASTNWTTGNNSRPASCIDWDRWVLRRLYASGGDAGFFFDETDHCGEPFTVVVEDCVGIGRAFGGGVAHPTARSGEPSVFRRCYLMALDWNGDTAAALVGGWERSKPSHPHAIFEDCTLVHPDNAVALSYASRSARVEFIRCRMLTLNFGQPEMGVLSTGIISTERFSTRGRLYVEVEDCVLAGYSVFSPGNNSKAAICATRGTNLVYTQFKQAVPSGFERVGPWPAEWFAHMAPPSLDAMTDTQSFSAAQPPPKSP